jgi:hypothetical protein
VNMLGNTPGVGFWKAAFLADIDSWCRASGLRRPTDPPAQSVTGSRTARHGDFASVTESLFAVFRFDPKATW